MLPPIAVAYGEAKVRMTLRTRSCFSEAWRGRWQVGDIEPLLRAYLARRGGD